MQNHQRSKHLPAGRFSIRNLSYTDRLIGICAQAVQERILNLQHHFTDLPGWRPETAKEWILALHRRTLDETGHYRLTFESHIVIKSMLPTSDKGSCGMCPTETERRELQVELDTLVKGQPSAACADQSAYPTAPDGLLPQSVQPPVQPSVPSGGQATVNVAKAQTTASAAQEAPRSPDVDASQEIEMDSPERETTTGYPEGDPVVSQEDVIQGLKLRRERFIAETREKLESFMKTIRQELSTICSQLDKH